MADPRLTVACADAARRAAVTAPGSTFNGIDWVEVDATNQRVLVVGFLRPLPGQPGGVPGAPALAGANIVVEGGERITGFRVLGVAASGRELTVTLDRAGDFSPYVLRLVRSSVDSRPPAGFDPALAAATFSFKANCESELDCRSPDIRQPAAEPDGPPPDYLAKDYDGFRRLMLDRLSTLVPGWSERNPADPLVTVVEALAHAADRLSYRQDAAATEAYLGTARSRIAIRRHARLLDYRVHDGCTARTWLALSVRAGSLAEADGIPAGTLAISTGPGAPAAIPAAALPDALAHGAVVFETLQACRPLSARNRITLHTWGGTDCRLRAGATRATLVNDPPLALVAGDLLLLEETRSPTTGRAADADPAHRQVVRLTAVVPAEDPVLGVPLLEVAWGAADALGFELAVTAVIAGSGVATSLVCAAARGNIVAAHHARPVQAALPPVPADPLRWRPLLSATPPACAESLPVGGPAADLYRHDPRRALPVMELATGGTLWGARGDLLASDRFDTGFVVETERDGRAWLRFGDDVNGRAPPPGAVFVATWRQGGGAAGNVGHGVLRALLAPPVGVEEVHQPLPARGGVDPERPAEVRLYAPAAFRTQERAVTAEDWVAMARRHPEVLDAAARLRWTGSWWTVFLTLDLAGGTRLAEDPALAARLLAELDRYRIAGYDLTLRDPIDLPVALGLHACLEHDAPRAAILAALRDAFGRGRRADGGRGFFHPDNFGFGQPLYASAVIAAAMRIAGLRAVRLTEMHPVGRLPGGELEAGLLSAGSLEIIRLDNDPSMPERGVLTLELEGGL